MIRAVISAALLMTAPAAQPPTSASFDALVERARVHFDAERYAEAASALQAAYAEAPEIDVLFNWANAERLADNCPRAIELYDRYLAASEAAGTDDDLSRQYAAVATQRRDECAAALPEPATAAVEPPAPSESSAVVPTPSSLPPAELEPPPQSTEASARPDALGWTLAATGVATTAAGVVLLGVAYRRDRTALDQPSHEAYLDRVRGASRLSTAGWTVLGIGAATAVGGIVRLAIVSRRGTESRRDARMRVGPGTLAVRF